MGNSSQFNFAAMQVLAHSSIVDPMGIQQLFDIFPIGIVIHTVAGTVSYRNDVAKSLLSMDENDLHHLPLSQFALRCGFHLLPTNCQYPLERLPVFQALQGAIASVEDIAVLGHEPPLVLQSTALPVRDAEGHITHVIAVYQDITAQVQCSLMVDRFADLIGAQVHSQVTALEQEILTRQWLEKELHQSQLRFQRFAEAVPGVMYSLRVNADRSVACEYLNHRAEAFFEATQLEIVQHPERYFFAQMHPADQRQFLVVAARCAKSQTVFSYEWRSISPSGQMRWLRARAQPELRDHGAICWHGMLLDISDRKREELEFRAQATQSAAVLKAIPDLIVRVDREGRYLNHVRDNPAIDVIPQNAITAGCQVTDYLPPAVAEQQLRLIQKALDTRQVQIREQTLTVHGRQQHEEVRVVPCGPNEVLLIVRDISDRKVAEFSLQEREAQHRRIITALPDLMFRVSREGYWLGYVHTNAIIDCLPEGYDPAGHHISDHMPPDIAQRHLEKIAQAIATGEMQVFEQQLTIAGRIQHEEVRIVPQGEDEVMFIVRDITDRKTVELALKDREAENRAILSAIPDLMFRLHRDGTFLAYFKNENTQDLLEKEQDPVGSNIFNYATNDFYTEHITKQMQSVHQALDTGVMLIYEQQIPVGDEWLHEEVRIVPIGPDEALVIVQNINDRKQSELALQQSEAQKQAILKAIPDLMFHLRQDGLILDYMGGTNFADLLENGESRVGQNLLDFAKTEALSAHIQRKMAATQRALTTGEMQLYEQVTHLEDTCQHEEVRIVPVNAHEVLVMIRDISDRKRIEAALRAANDRLEKLSLTDSLTMLANRRRLDEHLRHEWQRSLREQEPLSFILFDLDFFKRFNDTYGHQRGDECLHKVAQAVSSVVHRSSDLVARYGGEEFAVVLSNTQLKGAFIIAQRICEAIRDLKIPHISSEVGQVVTVSLGVSAIIPNQETRPNVLIRQADQALYAAKQAGRNNCQCFISR